MSATERGSPQVDPSAVAADQLKSLIERIERLEEEKAGLAGDIKDVYAEAKANGFDVKVLRKVVALRKRDHAERQEEEALLELYMGALGMLADTPLGQSAVQRDLAEKVAGRNAPKIARDPKFQASLRAMGTPVPLTEEERSRGGVAAFDRDGLRCSISMGRDAAPILREAAKTLRSGQRGRRGAAQ